MFLSVPQSPFVHLELVALEERVVPSEASAEQGLKFLRDMHDEFHIRFPVYDDVSSAGNHFPAIASLPDGTAPAKINGSWTDNPHSGATSIRNEMTPAAGYPYAGIYFQNGLLGADGKTVPQFGNTPNAGQFIPAPSKITFWARGEVGGEQIELFAFGVGWDPNSNTKTEQYADSSHRVPGLGTISKLTSTWNQYTIDVSKADTSYVLGGLGWTAEATRNPSGVVFYLDDIQYELTDTGRQTRQSDPHFVRSYRTGPFQSQPGPLGTFDFTLRNSSFAYDNALTMLAFLADRNPATQAVSLAHATSIGDTFVYASTHDRKYTDGRVRTDYSAGDRKLAPGWLANGKLDTAPVAGFFDEAKQTFFEIEQLNVDTGNNAWVMIGLEGLYAATKNDSYLTTARHVGEFIRTQKHETGTYQGFLAGINNADHLTAPPAQRPYASTEHNIDIYAAFTHMAQLTGDPSWQADAEHAWTFVEAMWDKNQRVYLTGTTDDEARNADVVPLDVQAWSILARPEVLSKHPELLGSIDKYFQVSPNAYDYDTDKDGVWTEGTAQVAAAFSMAGEVARVQAVRAQLDLIRNNSTAPGSDGFGMPAASKDGLSTGFFLPDGQPFYYHNRLHTGATAWTVFAQVGFNPYYQTFTGSPSVSDIPDQTTNKGQTVGPIAFTVADNETPVGRLTMTGTSSNTTLIPNANIVFGGTDANRTVTITPAAGQTGTATILVTVTDGSGAASTDTFTVTVNATPVVTVQPILVGALLNGTAQVFNPNAGKFDAGATKTFFSGSTGNVRTATADVNGDGTADFIGGTGPGTATQVVVIDGKTGATLATITPFEASFTGGVFIAPGDITGDGKADIIVTPDQGGGSVAAIYSGAKLSAGQTNDAAQVIRYFGIDDPSFRGGARATVGDITGDGVPEVIVSAGFLGGPRITIWSGTSVQSGAPVQLLNFFAFEDTLRNGAFVAAGDMNGDGKADIAFGGGPGGAPRVRVFDGAALLSAGLFANLDQVGTGQIGNFFAGDSALRGGVRLAFGNVDGDGKADLVTGSGEGEPSHVRVYLGLTILANPSGPSTTQEFDPFGTALENGVFVG